MVRGYQIVASRCPEPGRTIPKRLPPSHAALDHARQVTIGCSSLRTHVEVHHPGYPSPATLARRAVRAEAEASRLVVVRQACPGGSPSSTICEARPIEVDSPQALQAAPAGAPQAALAGASTPRLAGSQGLLA